MSVKVLRLVPKLSIPVPIEAIEVPKLPILSLIAEIPLAMPEPTSSNALPIPVPTAAIDPPMPVPIASIAVPRPSQRAPIASPKPVPITEIA